MKRFLNLSIFAILFLVTGMTAFGQEVENKRLMRNINVPLKSHIFPSLTGDGLFMIFYSDYSNTGEFELKYSKKTGAEFWEEAKYVENLVKHHNDHFGSYCLSYDGRYVFFASYRANGIGKYDIWFSERNGDSWSTPQNLGKPLNSPENDGNPCLSPDGRSLYFMRCQDMDAKSKSNCKIYVSKKVSDTRWGEPQALPDNINAFHSTSPRILIDNETLVYSSERSGGKGGLDLYMTRLVNNQWTDPVPYNFINTVRNDEFVSIPARGDLVFYTDLYKDQNNIYKAIIPEELRPRKVLLITGRVEYTDASVIPADIAIQAFEAKSSTLVSSVKPDADGSFFIALPEGKCYDFSVFPMSADHSYFSEMFDLKDMDNPRWEKLELTLERVRPGTTLDLSSTLEFGEFNNLSEKSTVELKRLMAILQKNPRLNMEIGVYTDSIIVDSIPNPGLTKVISDTTFFSIAKSGMADVDPETASLQKDSLSIRGFVLFKDNGFETTFYKVKYSYTNDDTEEKARAIADQLIKKGTPSYRVVPKGYGALREKQEDDAKYKVIIRFF